MDAKMIYDKANRLVRRYGTRDPFEIADAAGIRIYELPRPVQVLGMYTYRWRHRMIFLNPDLEPETARMVMAHEIGHDQLHRALAGSAGLHDLGLFSEDLAASLTESEANAFAAHLLIEESEMQAVFREGCDLSAAAALLSVHPQLLLIKLRELNRMGGTYRLPFEPDARFLRRR
ncbi:MAG: ImmA/IrrE family metallo-endopeptidase [Oscillospiraceae bacterium]|nr:ImmA/IrrE family metallo-endopeptidase [Oscillospiraceae bacterium]